MNVEIGTEAAQFPEKEYINGIAVAVWGDLSYLWVQEISSLITDPKELDHQSLIRLHAHSCTVYTANDSQHPLPPHSVSFSLIYRSYTRVLLYIGQPKSIDDISLWSRDWPVTSGSYLTLAGN